MTAVAGPDLREGFRQVMRRLVASVTVVAAARKGERFGLTATAVTSLSFDPPSLVVCVNRSAASFPILAEVGQRFSVSILAADQQAVSQAFGTPGLSAEERFAVGDWRVSASGVPLLEGAAACVELIVDAVHPYGSHALIIGRAEGTAAEDRPTLLYGAGEYGTLSPQ